MIINNNNVHDGYGCCEHDDWLHCGLAFSRYKALQNKPHNALQELYAASLLDCHNVTSTKA